MILARQFSRAANLHSPLDKYKDQGDHGQQAYRAVPKTDSTIP